MAYTDEMVLLAAEERWHDLWKTPGFDKDGALARLRIAVKGTTWAKYIRRAITSVPRMYTNSYVDKTPALAYWDGGVTLSEKSTNASYLELVGAAF